ncbi:hypothetical protein GCM10009733_021020 [Nonomuraea maheshkhaliensis]|uniref:Phytanoyl-CoA dioxygenase n=2 Tax=Nonomuraea maheshkhaliensis TaxID=419590 RepID=A0ABP4R0G1_9ACTN
MLDEAPHTRSTHLTLLDGTSAEVHADLGQGTIHLHVRRNRVDLDLASWQSLRRAVHHAARQIVGEAPASCPAPPALDGCGLWTDQAGRWLITARFRDEVASHLHPSGHRHLLHDLGFAADSVPVLVAISRDGAWAWLFADLLGDDFGAATVTLWHNTHPDRLTGWASDHEMTAVLRYTTSAPCRDKDWHYELDAIRARFGNVHALTPAMPLDRRYLTTAQRGLETGDVIVIGHKAWHVGPNGWNPVTQPMRMSFSRLAGDL